MYLEMKKQYIVCYICDNEYRQDFFDDYDEAVRFITAVQLIRFETIFVPPFDFTDESY